MIKHVGIMTDIRFSTSLTRFTLITESSIVDCVIGDLFLGAKLLYLHDNKYIISIGGVNDVYDDYDEIIVKRFKILNKDRLTDDLGL